MKTDEQKLEARRVLLDKKTACRLRGWKWHVNVVKRRRTGPAVLTYSEYGIGLVADDIFEVMADSPTPKFKLRDIELITEVETNRGSFPDLLLIILKP